ncbi:N-acetylmuramoyl-L-alanine amidase [Iodidimonas gelatinilytica]|uniref:N-acetylmuramoyl-L-alanine amidase n=1 Tax=Iodidimonas gelatinilytica TaxID=1236966 RepID=A0A5A7MMV1_9PROT|nr:N-acetylmuramoyl-L-alanine amidase [Iodidimonas gelatinilytica]GEQ97300.1 N-acetylmuramoyl-L-alanine amidase [Iodidimonas gelatinilytica]
MMASVPGIIHRPSPNFGPRADNRAPDMLLLHYTGMRTAQEALARLCDPAAQVSAHYLIDEDGSLYKLVEDDRRAWHAGVAHWEGDPDVNSRSIGIELVNPGHEFGYRPFPEPQIKRLIALAHDLLARYPIAPWHILGHSDVAPARKTDPGELFPWARLAEEGIGLFPYVADEAAHSLSDPMDAPCHETITELTDLLSGFGYGLPQKNQNSPGLEDIIRAAQRHWTPKTVTGVVNAPLLAILRALCAIKAAAPSA